MVLHKDITLFDRLKSRPSEGARMENEIDPCQVILAPRVLRLRGQRTVARRDFGVLEFLYQKYCSLIRVLSFVTVNSQ